MSWMDFGIRLLVGFFLGVGIGIERQWLRSRAILKTNVLVTLGAAMFVMLSIMTPGDASPTRISAQIVSGVGFLGGGVILREGASVRGTNTAATLWCAAAIGTLVGSGHLIQAYLGTFAVVSANLLLRPLVEAFRQPDMPSNYPNNDDSYWENESEKEILPAIKDRSFVSTKSSDFSFKDRSQVSLLDSTSQMTRYVCYLTCYSDRETQVLARLFESSKKLGWKLTQLDSKYTLNGRSANEEDTIEIKAAFLFQNEYFKPEDIDEIISSLKSESLISSVSWQFAT